VNGNLRLYRGSCYELSCFIITTHSKCFVKAEFLYNHTKGHGELVPCVWVSLKSIRGQVFRIESLLTEYGALYDKLPMHHAYVWKEVSLKASDLPAYVWKDTACGHAYGIAWDTGLPLLKRLACVTLALSFLARISNGILGHICSP
jgi:hypothetical protein